MKKFLGVVFSLALVGVLSSVTYALATSIVPGCISTSGYSSTTGAPCNAGLSVTATVTSTDLSLEYGGDDDEGYLTGKMTVSIYNSSNKDIRLLSISPKFTNLATNLSSGTNETAVSLTSVDLDNETLNFVTGGSVKVYRIREGETGRFVVTMRDTPKLMFSGVYKMSISQIALAYDDTEITGNFDYTSVVVPEMSSNAVAIVGEQSPYISSTNSPLNGNDAVLSGARFSTIKSENKVYISGVYKGDIAAPSGGVSLTIPYSWFGGAYISDKGGSSIYQDSVQIENPKYGKSNSVTIRVKETTQTCYIFSRNLTTGSKGADVTALQNFLISKGYMSGSATGYFGSSTRTALAAYQASKGISPANGYFGVITRATVNADCGGVSTPSITYVQAKAADKNIIYSGETAVIYGANLDGDVSVFMDSEDGSRVYQLKVVESGQTGGSQMIISSLDTNYALDGYYYLSVTKSGIISNKIRVQYINHVATPSITVISPNGGENLLKGGVHRITWKSSGAEDTVDLLLKGCSSCSSRIGSNLPNIGYYDWVVNNSVSSPKGEYKIDISSYDKISNNGNWLIDESDAYFTISSSTSTQPSITVVSPNGGESYKSGDTVNIKWNSNNLGSLNLWLTLADKYGTTAPGGFLNAANIPNTGSYSWVIPKDIVSTGTSGAFKIVASTYDGFNSSNGPTSSDLSDNYFTINQLTTTPTPTASLTANGTAQLTVNTGTNISYKWSSTNAVKASATYTTNAPYCGVGGTWWQAQTLNGSTAPATFSSKYAGCIYTITYTATNSVGVSASSVLIIELNGITPTVKLSASPTTVLSTSEPKVTTLSWLSTNTGSCLFEDQTLVTSGSMTVPVSQTDTFTVSCSGPGGTTTSNPVTVTYKEVEPLLPTASITANGTNSLNVEPGVNVTYKWSSTNAVKASATYTTNLTRCGAGGSFWQAQTLNGSSVPGTFSSASAGCIYTVTYTAVGSDGISTSSVLTINVGTPTTGATAGSILSRFLKSFGW